MPDHRDAQAHQHVRDEPPGVSAAACFAAMRTQFTALIVAHRFQYDVCVQLDDGHGFSAGIIQFTTATGSAGQVIGRYSAKQYPNEFTPMNATLTAIAKQRQTDAGLVSSVAGLEGYCAAWIAASAKPAFRDAQLAGLVDLYLVPSQRAADRVGLKLAVSFGQVYDSTIQMGSMGTQELLDQVTARRGDPTPDTEVEWMSEFLDARERKLIAMGGACE
ncbi:lysozyme-like domain-containing protein [Entophlyctis helioformis]|nr:lysozyme-like domain-containing protein [Entophlyctis helioformis]